MYSKFKRKFATSLPALFYFTQKKNKLKQHNKSKRYSEYTHLYLQNRLLKKKQTITVRTYLKGEKILYENHI